MIKRIVKMSFHPENIEAFKNIFATNWKSIKGYEGCLHVELLQDELQPSQFFTYSLWESEAHLNVYRNSALFEQVWSATKALFNNKPQAWTLNEISFKD